MRRPLLVAATAILGAAPLAAAAPASAAYDGGITAVSLADARPGAVARPFSVRIAQTGEAPAPRELRLAVQGLVLDPGTTPNHAIGALDLETSLGPFTGLAVTTAGPGDGAPGRWTLAVPGVPPVAATVRPSSDLDAAGVPVVAAGSTLVGVTIPTELPLGAKLTAVTLRLNVDERRCASPFPGATNPTTPGTYRVRAFVGAADGQSRVSDGTVTVAAGAPAGPALPAGCPTGSGDGSSVAPAPTPLAAPVVRLKAASRTVRPGRSVRILARVTGGPADVRVLRGSRTLARLKAVGPSGRRFTFRATRGDAGKVVRLLARPAGGEAAAIRIRVARR
jgi:hypothetical protein